MIRIAHLSDLHHQLDWPARPWASSGWRGAIGRFELHALRRWQRFAGVGDRIRRLIDRVETVDADQVIVTGDLSALGDPAELDEVRALLQPLIDRGRLAVIPGNHDRYVDAPGARGFEPRFEDLLRSDLPGVDRFPTVRLVGDRHAIIGLDSTRVGAITQYFFGRLGEAQRDRLSALLDDPRLAGRTLIVLCHHGLAGPGGTFDWRESGLLDGARLAALLRDRPVVFLHGHSHHRYWHRARDGRPHAFGGGSSTEPGKEGLWLIALDDHRRVEAQAIAL